MPSRHPLRIGEALGPEHLERVAQKIKDKEFSRWCYADECACMGCWNLEISWAEYECWRKYNPKFNKVRQG